ncbi:MAG TPA: hypothetical protein VFB32_12770 [Rudaea sp.]|nr:hypothetical protein [Rudaea sp.]
MSSGNDQFERDFEEFLKAEDSSLDALYRKLPQPEPDARLDAAVLAMAHRALNPGLVATPRAPAAARKRVRWLPALGAAAGVVFAAGIALRLAPQVWNEHRTAAPQGARDQGVIHVLPVDAPAISSPPPASPPPPPSAANTTTAVPPAALAGKTGATPATTPPPFPAAPARELARARNNQAQPAPAKPEVRADAEQLDAKKAEIVQNAEPAPQAFPAQPKAEHETMDAVERTQAVARGAWWDRVEPTGKEEPKAEAADTASAASNSASGFAAAPAPSAPVQAAAPTPPPAERATAAPAGAASKMRAPSTQAPSEESSYSPEVRRNSHLYPESWVAAIQKLVRDGKHEEALENIELFRKKYPDYRLPADLNTLK